MHGCDESVAAGGKSLDVAWLDGGVAENLPVEFLGMRPREEVLDVIGRAELQVITPVQEQKLRAERIKPVKPT